MDISKLLCKGQMKSWRKKMHQIQFLSSAMERQSQGKRPQHNSVASGVYNHQEGFITCLLLAAAKVAQDKKGRKMQGTFFSVQIMTAFLLFTHSNILTDSALLLKSNC